MRHESARVSVIIPCFNAADFIGATIGSVLRQTRPAAEILVIDDGSTDQSARVLESFGDRIRVLRKPNGGPASARNLGLRQATGDYLAFLDSDDLWEEEKLERQLAEFDAHPETGLLFSEAWMFREVEGARSVMARIGYTGDPSFRQLLFGDYIPNSTVIIRRQVADAVGPLNERRELIGVEDYEYWLRIARRFRLRGMAAPLAWYRIREGNLMGTGADIEKGLRLALAAIGEIEAHHAEIWEEHGVDRARLMARLHLRAGHAWKKRGEWRRWLEHTISAGRHCHHPRVWRWMAAAAILRRWS